MKKILMSFLACFMLSTFSYAQTVFTESFDAGSTPAGWNNTSVSGGPWVFSTGADYDVRNTPDHTGNSGNYAWVDFSGTDDSVILVTPAIDVSSLTTPYLEFYHESHYTGTLTPFNSLHVEAWNGSAWVNVISLQGNTAFGWDQYGYDMSTFTFAGGDSLRVRFHAESGGASNDYNNDLLIDDIAVMQMPSCLNPNSLTATNVASTSADFGWTEPATATSWQIEYGTQGFTQGTGMMVVTATNPYNATGLTPNTSYSFYVRSICGAGDTSSWIGPLNFTTTCPSAYTPTYTQDFTTFLDPCWSEAQGTLTTSTTLTGTTSSWTSDGFANNGSTGAAKINLYGTSADEWLLSPSIDLGNGAMSYQLEFDIALTDWGNTSATNLGSDDTIAVVISTDNGATWEKANTLQLWAAGSEPSHVGEHIVINLSAYTGVVKFGFYTVSTVSNEDNDVFIDNFLVTNLANCPVPNALTANNVTQNTADLGWTENGSATSWQIEYGTQGFAQGTGTYVVAGANPHNQTGLMPSTDYQFYVRAICGAGDTSNWAGPFSFQTACGAIVAPWTETFAGGLPNCWTDRGNDPFIFNTGAGFGAANAGDYTAGGGTNYAWVDGSGTSGTFDTLTTPLIDVSGLTTPHLCFGLFSNNTNSAGNNTIMIQFFDGATWNNLATFQQNLGPAWAPLSFDLSGYTITGNTQVRFVINTNSSTSTFHNDILIDDVSLNNGGCPQFCIAPSTLTATNIAQTTVDLGWTENGAATSWEIEYGTQGFAQGSGTTVVTGTNPHGITGLTDNTNYSFYVRAVCGAGDSSLWTGPFNFTTLASCPFPSALTATNIMPTSADLGWTENGSATSWEIEYGTQGFAQGSGTTVVTGTNPHNLTGLMHSTDHQFYVRAICGAGDSSLWTGPFDFKTACGAIVAPWTETFTGGLPNCWTDRGNDAFIFSTSAAYGAANAGDYTTGGGTNYAWVDGSGATGTFDTLTTPPVDISALTTPHLCFALFSNNTNDAGNNTIMIQFFDGATWNNLATYQQNLGPAWAPLSFDLSGYTITGNTHVRFIVNTNSTGDAFYNDILIDDVSLNNGGCPQFCIAPSALTATNITQYTADLGWTESGAATSWEIEYGTQGFAQGSGTVVVTGTNPHNLTGLTPGTDYEFYVRSICGAGDSSTWVGPFNFTTYIPPYYSISQINSVDTNGVADSLGVTARIRGVVHCIDFRGGTGLEFYMSEYTNTGIKVFDFADVSGYTVNEGDSLEVWGSVSQFNGHLQFDPDSIAVLSTGNPLLMPTTVTQLSEATENKFIEFQNAWLVDANQWTGSGSGFNVDVTNGTDTIVVRIDNASSLYGQPAPTGTFNVSGWGGQYDTSVPRTEGYQMFPCGMTSIIPIVYDVAPASFFNLDSTYCNVATVSGSVIITNMTPLATSNIPYTITANGFLLAHDTIATLAGNASDTITVGPLPATTGMAMVQVVTDLSSDNDTSNDTLSMVVSISNTAASATAIAMISCHGDSTGAAMATATNGIGMYTYAWDANAGNATTDSVANLTAGSYVVTITDSIGCADTAMVTITEPTAINLTDTVYNVSCNGDSTGMAVVMATGGTPAYTFNWSTGAAGDSLNNVPAGTYTAMVTDANGCMDSIAVTVTEPTAISLTDTVYNVSCNGDSTGMAVVMATGGTPAYTFNWSTGAAGDSLNNVPAGTYTVVVTDANGCMDSTSTTVTEPTALDVTIADNGDGTATATGTGGVAPYSYQWDAAAANQTTDTASGLIHNGSYGVTITDANGCTDTASVVVNIIAITTIDANSSLSMFPNPASNNVFVKLDLAKQTTVSLQVMNAVGQTVIQKSLGTVQEQTVELNTSNLTSGVYLVQFNIGEKQISKKLIISKS